MKIIKCPNVKTNFYRVQLKHSCCNYYDFYSKKDALKALEELGEDWEIIKAIGTKSCK